MVVSATMGLMLQKFNTAIQINDIIDERSKTDIGNLDNAWGGSMDWFFIALLTGLPLASMALAHFNNIPSTYFYLLLGVLLLMVFIGWGLQGGYENLQAQGGDFANYLTDEMPLTNFILTNFGLYSVIIVLIIGYGTYVKQRQGVGF